MTGSHTRDGFDPGSGIPLSKLDIRHLWLLPPFVGISIGASGAIADNSFLWHVRAGMEQLRIGEVIRTDPFSLTELGAPWRTQSWLLELLYGWLFRLSGGLRWVPAMIAVLLGVTLVFVGLATYRWVRDPRLVAGALTVAMWVSLFFGVPRPVVGSFALLAVLAVVLQNADRVGWGIVPILWTWAAIHGSWVIGVGLVGLEALRVRSWRLATLCGFGILATLFTAHGLGTWGIVLEFAENRAALSYLSEWGRPDFTEPLIAPALLIMAAAAIALATRRIAVNHVLVVAPFIILGSLQIRSVFPAVIVLLPLAAAVFGDRRGPVCRAAGSNRAALGAAAILLVAAAAVTARPVRLDDKALPPPGAVEALDGRVAFHGPAAGGYLIYAEWPRRLVFVDDRAELYGADRLAQVRSILLGESHTALFDEYGVGQVLLESGWPLVDNLKRAGWRVRFQDDHWIVLAGS